MATDLTRIFMLHKHVQQLDGDLKHEVINTQEHDMMTQEWDDTMQQLVKLMGEATRRTMC